MDYPLAPKLCGGVIGRALLAGLLPPSALVDLCKPIEAGETRRALMAPALQYVKVARVLQSRFTISCVFSDSSTFADHA
jgi:hypothetical protein